MTDRFDLVFVSPHPIAALLPTRPARLLEALRANPVLGAVTVVNRRRPSTVGRLLRSRALENRTRIADDVVAIDHPWPFGTLEARWMERLVHHVVLGSGRPVVLWICDPKSARVLSRLRDIPTSRLVKVFDAYDAWDLSPLVRGRWRRAAVASGYRVAAQDADIVFANTPFMARRMQALGAATVSVLQNAAPQAVADNPRVDRKGDDFLLYVGRIHERVDARLLAAVADAFPGVMIRLIGPVERDPDGWSELVARANVSLEGPVVGERLRSILASATALLLPHRVDDYTRSQDSMKAWDALAVGTPVVTTPLPPGDCWPAGLAAVGSDTRSFVAGVRSALEGELDASRPLRLRFAQENGWETRATTAIRAIERIVKA